MGLRSRHPLDKVFRYAIIIGDRKFIYYMMNLFKYFYTESG